MKYTVEQYRTLSERFNKMSFLQKIVTVKNNSDVFTLESDGYNFRLRLEEEAQKLELDLLFSFPEFLEFSQIKDIMSLIDLKIKELR